MAAKMADGMLYIECVFGSWPRNYTVLLDKQIPSHIFITDKRFDDDCNDTFTVSARNAFNTIQFVSVLNYLESSLLYAYVFGNFFSL